MNWLYCLAAALFGLTFGSFFNVCIYRLPREKKLGQRSVCPGCGATIRWYDNIPLASFIVLKGKCRDCGMRISLRYPAVELATALLFVLMYWWSVARVPEDLKMPGGPAFVPEVLIGLLLVSVMTICVGVDITHGLVPNKAVIPGTMLMLCLVVGVALYRGEPGRILIALGSGAVGGGFLFMAGIAYGFLFMRKRVPGESGGDEAADNLDAPGEPGAADYGRREVEGEHENNYRSESGHGRTSSGYEMESGTDEPLTDKGDSGDRQTRDDDCKEIPTGVGMGDVKLMFFAGLALGYFHWYLIMIALFLGYLLGAFVSVLLIVFAGLTRRDRIPFVPFLAVGTIVALIWGQWFVDLYLKLLR